MSVWNGARVGTIAACQGVTDGTRNGSPPMTRDGSETIGDVSSRTRREGQ